MYDFVDKSHFVDYELRHWDLAVEIDGSSASFYVDQTTDLVTHDRVQGYRKAAEAPNLAKPSGSISEGSVSR